MSGPLNISFAFAGVANHSKHARKAPYMNIHGYHRCTRTGLFACYVSIITIIISIIIIIISSSSSSIAVHFSWLVAWPGQPNANHLHFIYIYIYIYIYIERERSIIL